MNLIKNHQIVLSFDTWEPFQKLADEDIDTFVHMIKTKELLKHCGNVHLHFEEKGDK